MFQVGEAEFIETFESAFYAAFFGIRCGSSINHFFFRVKNYFQKSSLFFFEVGIEPILFNKVNNPS
jgi:hypothetical protein